MKFTAFVVVLGALALAACGDDSAKHAQNRAAFGIEAKLRPVTKVPAAIRLDCREGGAKIYDECSDQVDLFQRGQEMARAQNKVLLVSYGAEWCIWCHVFDKYVDGETGRLDYNLEGAERTLREKGADAHLADAVALNNYVADNFVVVHVDAEYAPNSQAVLDQTGAASHFVGEVPFIFSIDEAGKAAAFFDHKRVEVSTDSLIDGPFRGYDRAKLRTHLAELHDAALRSE